MSEVSREVAESEFDRFVEAIDIDVDKSLMDEDEQRSFDKIKNRLITAITNGSLIINTEGMPEYTPQKSNFQDSIVFRERTGSTVLAADNKKKNADGAKMYAMMATLMGIAPNQVAGLKGIDIKVCEGIFMLLMD